VINKGADIYNAGDHYGCYRFYHGALTATLPLLDHKPQLQDLIKKAFVDAEFGQQPAFERAFVLRRAIDAVRKDLGGGGTAAAKAELKKALDKNGAKPEDAKALLDIVETTRKEIVAKAETAKKLWDSLGGEENVAKVVDDFMAGLVNNPDVKLFPDEDTKKAYL